MSKHNKSFEYLIDTFRNLGLPDHSRTRMRAELAAYADFHPVQTPLSVSGIGWFQIHRSSTAFVAALLLIALMGGTAYASEHALPGDALYTVKVHIAEPVEVAFASTLEDEAVVHAELAERRLNEAVQLAVEERLDVPTEEYLEQKFSTHVDNSLAAADKLSEAGNAEASLMVRSKLEARLIAHADILDVVEDRLDEAGDAKDDQREITQELLDAVKLRQGVVSETRLALERNLEDDITQTQALAFVTKADMAVAPAHASSLPSQITMHLEQAQDAIDEAKESLEGDGRGNAGHAFRMAYEAERSTEVAIILLDKRDLLEMLDVRVSSESGATTTSTSTTATSTDEATVNGDDETATTTFPLLR